MERVGARVLSSNVFQFGPFKEVTCALANRAPSSLLYNLLIALGHEVRRDRRG